MLARTITLVLAGICLSLAGCAGSARVSEARPSDFTLDALVTNPRAAQEQPPRFRRPALAFVSRQHHRLAGASHQIGEDLVRRDHAGAGIDEKQHDIGLRDGLFGLLAHAHGEPRIAGLQPRGIDERHIACPQLGLRLTPIPRQARLIVDQRQPPAREPVEQGGLADIGPADNGQGKTHLSGSGTGQAARLHHSRVSGKRGVCRRR